MTPRSGRSSRASGCLRHKPHLHQNPVQRLPVRGWAGDCPQQFFCQDKIRRGSRRNLPPTKMRAGRSSLDWYIRSSTRSGTKARQVLSKFMAREATKCSEHLRHSLLMSHPRQSWRAAPLPPQAASVWHADTLDGHRDCGASVSAPAVPSQPLQ